MQMAPPESTAEEATPQTTAPEPSRRIAILRYDEYFDLRTFSQTLRKTSKKSAKSKTKSTSVLLVRRIIDDKGRHRDTEIDIMSTKLQEVITEINKGVLGFRLAGDRATVDPKILYHSLRGMCNRLAEEKAKEFPDEAFIFDLQTACDFTKDHFSSTIAELGAVFSGRTEILFEHLWALISPNIHVYCRTPQTGQDQILWARAFSIYSRFDGSSYGNVLCDIISNDGEFFGVARVNLEINHFKGWKRIQDLEVYPLWIHPERAVLVKDAIYRGKKYAQLAKSSYHEIISGPAMIQVEEKLRKSNVHGRVMIDASAFRTYEANADKMNTPVHQGLSRNSLTDSDYMICNPVALGFCFGTKSWGGFAMDRLQDVVWSDEAFNSLVLGDTQKILIHALVKQHVARAAQYDDIVHGKGKGLIGLLSGKPGCGKTLTAEAVAEITRRPLYVVSAGELGTVPSSVDQMLSRILELAHRWDAVLLLDEAEVFLQERSTQDVTRNALVSIFLRQLEYYQGILILTTNLASQCDKALESRIHFCIYYPDLDYNARLRIWEMFLLKGSLDPARGLSDFNLDRLAQLQLNGRQIKNVVANAQSIALEYKAPLSMEHIETSENLGLLYELAVLKETVFAKTSLGTCMGIFLDGPLFPDPLSVLSESSTASLTILGALKGSLVNSTQGSV
ncbi:P-loop containing nucleoside triphosphate hydrolase protein [Armillaria novae-zelandiae]|uniref:P-loop containing nucleoside triphosphate hydrolase protein n=1 Tax=Armillaria novae-zelandiae TaxID=153914 RepID=A0AA39PR10_9AGAR|nr:P-loop containing nucleoside triphosphate hydrolase protein [Armillaria novae-zelandiae]